MEMLSGDHIISILDQQSIEKIQRRATRLLTGLNVYDTPYSECLDIFSGVIPSLQYRQFRGDMILLYRLAHSDIGITFLTISLIQHTHPFLWWITNSSTHCPLETSTAIDPLAIW